MKGKIFKHKGSGKNYTVLMTGLREHDRAKLVIYNNIEPWDTTIWVRPLEEFNQRFEELEVKEVAS